jgi:nucleotidyltransferase/DNA polymerase involved in DNA repair
MRIVCVYIPHFYVQVERLKDPALSRRPVIVGGMPEERASVRDCSDEATARGVSPSMSLKDACHLCPDGVFIPFEEKEYEDTREEVLSALACFSLRIESPEPAITYLDVTRVLKLCPTEELLAREIVETLSGAFRLKAKVGAGNSRFVALEAASSALDDLWVIAPGKEKVFLSSLSVERLSLPEDIKERLRLLGLHTLDKVVRLSQKALISQFGSMGASIWKFANGVEDIERIPLRRIITSLEREMVCETPLDTLEQLRMSLDRAMEALTCELTSMGKLCRKVRLVLFLHDGEMAEKCWVMHTPTGSKEEVLRRAFNGLEDLSLKSPVTGFVVSALALSPRESIQETLFKARLRRIKGFNSFKGYLKAKYGEIPVARIEEGDVNARLPEKRFIFVEV